MTTPHSVFSTSFHPTGRGEGGVEKVPGQILFCNSWELCNHVIPAVRFILRCLVDNC